VIRRDAPSEPVGLQLNAEPVVAVLVHADARYDVAEFWVPQSTLDSGGWRVLPWGGHVSEAGVLFWTDQVAESYISRMRLVIPFWVDMYTAFVSPTHHTLREQFFEVDEGRWTGDLVGNPGHSGSVLKDTDSAQTMAILSRREKRTFRIGGETKTLEVLVYQRPTSSDQRNNRATLTRLARALKKKVLRFSADSQVSGETLNRDRRIIYSPDNKSIELAKRKRAVDRRGFTREEYNRIKEEYREKYGRYPDSGFWESGEDQFWYLDQDDQSVTHRSGEPSDESFEDFAERVAQWERDRESTQGDEDDDFDGNRRYEFYDEEEADFVVNDDDEVDQARQDAIDRRYERSVGIGYLMKRKEDPSAEVTEEEEESLSSGRVSLSEEEYREWKETMKYVKEMRGLKKANPQAKVDTPPPLLAEAMSAIPRSKLVALQREKDENNLREQLAGFAERGVSLDQVVFLTDEEKKKYPEVTWPLQLLRKRVKMLTALEQAQKMRREQREKRAKEVERIQRVLQAQEEALAQMRTKLETLRLESASDEDFQGGSVGLLGPSSLQKQSSVSETGTVSSPAADQSMTLSTKSGTPSRQEDRELNGASQSAGPSQ